jgi:hypothetical protein
MSEVGARRKGGPGGQAPLSAKKKWQSIMLATLVLVPAYWFLMAGVVSAASKRGPGPTAAPFIAFGLCLIPFVFVVLAFTSGHQRAPGAIVRAMGLTLLVGITVSALVPDAITGFVAGIGAGGIVALRPDGYVWKNRALAVAAVALWAALTVRFVPEAALLIAPVLPFTSIGVADHITERREEQARAAARGGVR